MDPNLIMQCKYKFLYRSEYTGPMDSDITGVECDAFRYPNCVAINISTVGVKCSISV